MPQNGAEAFRPWVSPWATTRAQAAPARFSIRARECLRLTVDALLLAGVGAVNARRLFPCFLRNLRSCVSHRHPLCNQCIDFLDDLCRLKFATSATAVFCVIPVGWRRCAISRSIFFCRSAPQVIGVYLRLKNPLDLRLPVLCRWHAVTCRSRPLTQALPELPPSRHARSLYTRSCAISASWVSSNSNGIVGISLLAVSCSFFWETFSEDFTS